MSSELFEAASGCQPRFTCRKCWHLCVRNVVNLIAGQL